MFRKRFAVLIIATSTLVACTAPPATKITPTTRPSAQLGTVSPAYPVGDLEPRIDVLEKIPVDKLSTAEPLPFEPTDDPCTIVPADVVTSAGIAMSPVFSSDIGCAWQGSGLGLEIGAMPTPMVKAVEEHLAMANGGTTDRLAHLAWLRIDGHYAIERILKFDRTKGCWLTLDISAPATMHVLLYPVDASTGKPASSDTDTSVNKLCPVTRRIVKNLLDHFYPAWWETVIRPTG